jgi:hypothetical protein
MVEKGDFAARDSVPPDFMNYPDQGGQR